MIFLFVQAKHPIVVTVLYIAHKIVKYLIPQWTICVVFGPLKTRRPLSRHQQEETDTFSWADNPVSIIFL